MTISTSKNTWESLPNQFSANEIKESSNEIKESAKYIARSFSIHLETVVSESIRYPIESVRYPTIINIVPDRIDPYPIIEREVEHSVGGKRSGTFGLAGPRIMFISNSANFFGVNNSKVMGYGDACLRRRLLSLRRRVSYRYYFSREHQPQATSSWREHRLQHKN